MSAWKPVDVEASLPALRAYARALTRDHVAADDLVQDTLVRAYERAATYRAEMPLKPWLLTILHRLFVDRQRRLSAESRGAGHAAPIVPELAQGGGQEHAVHLREVAAHFAALPDEQRSVLHLVAVEGLTYHEASLALDTPIGTIMSRLSRARAALRKAGAAGADAVLPGAPLRIVGGKDAS